MSPLSMFQSMVNVIKYECYYLAGEAGLFLEVDEAGNIWLGDGKQEECFRVCGWHMTNQKIKQIIHEKELNTSAEIK